MVIWFVSAENIDTTAFVERFEKALKHYNLLIENGCKAVTISSQNIKKIVIGHKSYLSRKMFLAKSGRK